MIDEKGRLFGKINIIDLLVIILVLIVAVVVGLKFLGKGGSVPGSGGGTNIVYTVKVPKVEPAVYDALKASLDAGDTRLMANGEMLNGNVTGVTSAVHTEDVMTADGRIVTASDAAYLDLTFSMEATVTNPITQAVGTQEVRIGKTYIVKTKTFELTSGTILTCDVVEPAA